jgi:hypothetical protein
MRRRRGDHPRQSYDRIGNGFADHQPPGAHGSPVIALKTYGHHFGNTDASAAEIMGATFAKGRKQ